MEFQKFLEPFRAKLGTPMDYDTENEILGILSVMARRRHPITTARDDCHVLNSAMVTEIKINLTKLMDLKNIEMGQLILNYNGEFYGGDYATYNDESIVINCMRTKFMLNTSNILEEWYLRWENINAEDKLDLELDNELEYGLGHDFNNDCIETFNKIPQGEYISVMMDMLRCMGSRAFPDNILANISHKLNSYFVEGLIHKFIEYAKYNKIPLNSNIYAHNIVYVDSQLPYIEELLIVNSLKDCFGITCINDLDITIEFNNRWAKINADLKTKIRQNKLKLNNIFAKRLLLAKKEQIPKNIGRLAISGKTITVSQIVHLAPIQ